MVGFKSIASLGLAGWATYQVVHWLSVLLLVLLISLGVDLTPLADRFIAFAVEVFPQARDFLPAPAVAGSEVGGFRGLIATWAVASLLSKPLIPLKIAATLVAAPRLAAFFRRIGSRR